METNQQIDHEKTPEEIFTDAIGSKERARQSYLVMADKVVDEAARGRLRDLADRKRVHRATLERKFRELSGKEFPSIEPPSPPALPPDIENFTVAKVLKMALEQQRNSESHYRFLAEKTEDPKVRDLYNELAELEWKHKSRLESELTAATDPGEFLFEI